MVLGRARGEGLDPRGVTERRGDTRRGEAADRKLGMRNPPTRQAVREEAAGEEPAGGTTADAPCGAPGTGGWPTTRACDRTTPASSSNCVSLRTSFAAGRTFNGGTGARPL